MKQRVLATLAALVIVAASGYATAVHEQPQTHRPTNVGVETEKPPVAIERITERFPVHQAAVLFKMAGNEMQGVYMLAEYDSAPESIYVKYENTGEGTRPFREFQYVTVYAPNGDTVLFYDFSDVLPGKSREVIIRLPEVEVNKQGIWRVSFIGGQHGDRVELALPDTDTWGIGGVAKLGVTETTPEDLYAYLPESVDKFRVYTYPFSNEMDDMVNVSIHQPNGELYAGPDAFDVGMTNGVAVRRRLTIEPGKDISGNDDPDVDVTGTVWRISQNTDVGDAIYVVSSPELLCPTPEAARALRGGTFEVGGITVQGPLQKRAREAMLQFDPEVDFDVELDWPDVSRDYVESLADPQLEALMWGYYGGLPHVDHVFDKQVIDPDSPAYGLFIHDSGKFVFHDVNWHNFYYPKPYNNLTMAHLAALLTVPTESNVTYRNREVLNRAQLSALAMINMLPSVGILRSVRAEWGDGLSLDGFFQFSTLAEAYYHLENLLDPEVRRIYEQALLFYADHYGNFTHFMPNQVYAMISGYLYVYLATDEPRFLRKFERMTRAYTAYTFNESGTYQAMNPYGQHPAGYFLEQWGPDGNYDTMNQELLIQAYYKYRNLPEADPSLIARMRDSFQESLVFQQFHWLPQPDGTIISPNSINARTTIPYSASGHPGAAAAYPEFPIAAAKFHLTPAPEDGGPGSARVTNHVANTEEWQRDLIYWGLSGGGDAFDGDRARTDLTGQWARWTYDAFSMPERVAPATLPFEESSGIWELEGQVAFKHGDLFATVFYGGDSRNVRGRMSGAPVTLWSEETGSIVHSMRHNQGARPDGRHMTSTLLRYGSTDAAPQEGAENGELRWIELDRVFEITSSVRWLAPQGTDIGSVPDTEVTWRYELHDDGRVSIDVSHSGDVGDDTLFLNVPVLVLADHNEDFAVTGPDDGSLRISRGDVVVEIAWPDNLEARMTTAKSTGFLPDRSIRSLQIPVDSRDSVRIVLERQ